MFAKLLSGNAVINMEQICFMYWNGGDTYITFVNGTCITITQEDYRALERALMSRKAAR